MVLGFRMTCGTHRSPTSVFLHWWQPKTSFKLYRLTRTLVPQEVFDPAPGCPSTFQKPPQIASRDTGSRHLATVLWCSYSNRWRQSCMENWDPTVRVSGHEKNVTSIALDLCRTEHELLQKKWIRNYVVLVLAKGFIGQSHGSVLEGKKLAKRRGALHLASNSFQLFFFLFLTTLIFHELFMSFSWDSFSMCFLSVTKNYIRYSHGSSHDCDQTGNPMWHTRVANVPLLPTNVV